MPRSLPRVRLVVLVALMPWDLVPWPSPERSGRHWYSWEASAVRRSPSRHHHHHRHHTTLRLPQRRRRRFDAKRLHLRQQHRPRNTRTPPPGVCASGERKIGSRIIPRGISKPSTAHSVNMHINCWLHHVMERRRRRSTTLKEDTSCCSRSAARRWTSCMQQRARRWQAWLASRAFVWR